MSILVDGFHVFLSNWIAVAILLIGPLGCGVWLAQPFVSGHKRSIPLTLAMAIPLGWIMVALFVTLITLLDKTGALTLAGAWIVFGISCTLLGVWILKAARSLLRITFSMWLGCTAALALGLLVLALRLTFVKDLLLPPYSDSLFHVQLSESFFTGHGLTATLQSRGYYHFGLHALTALSSTLTGLPPIEILALVGQMLVAVFPLGVFAFLLIWKNRFIEALLGALLAGFAWGFPAFTANWGKYPTLAAASLLPVFATLALLVSHARKRTWLLGLLAILGAGSLLFHTRLTVLFGLAAGAWVLTWLAWKMKHPVIQQVFQAGLLAATLWLLFINQEITFAYVHDHFMVFLILAITLPLLSVKPSFVLRVATLFTIGLLLWTGKPAPFALFGGAVTLLDVPFVLSILAFPLSLWLVAGIEAATTFLLKTRLNQRAVGMVLLLALLTFAMIRAAYRPDPCCNWARPADLAAIDWIERNLPEDTQIFAPGVETSGRLASVDAGLWIGHLTGREVILMPLDTLWFEPGMHATVCQQAQAYIYDSGLDQSFQIDDTSYPKWYKAVYSTETVAIYSILPCLDILDY